MDPAHRRVALDTHGFALIRRGCRAPERIEPHRSTVLDDPRLAA
jgi:hypothetical protein